MEGSNDKVMKTRKKRGEGANKDLFLLFEDIGNFGIIDFKKMESKNEINIIENIPTNITGTYVEDYNISYVDHIIRKKLDKEKFTHLEMLKKKYKLLESVISKPQTFLDRENTLNNMSNIKKEIEEISSEEKIKKYDEKVKNILKDYKKYSGKIKTITFDGEENYKEYDEQTLKRISLIENFIKIASDYIPIDIIRINNFPPSKCYFCGFSLLNVAINEDGTQRCPECQTEHDVIILAKLSKDSARIIPTNNTDDESIENFMRAFIRYQGLQSDIPDENLYLELDEYFKRHGRPLGDEIKSLPLNIKGLRGDTNHKMLWNALSQIGRSSYYEDTNLIGHIYWGWKLPDVMHHKETIVLHYLKTQKVFYQIPSEERGRDSSLGTQFRLWRHLQLVGHNCSIEEFKVAENPESLRIHNKLWRMMCEGCNDPAIYYIE